MKVGINNNFRRFTACGQGRYFLGLLTALRYVDRSTEYVEIGPPDGETELEGRVRKSFREAGWEILGATLDAYRQRIDLLHNPYWTSPLFPLPRTVVTVHDIVPVMPGFEMYCQNLRSWAYYRLMSYTTRHASAIIADTRAAADDIQATLGISGRKIHVIPLAPDPSFGPATDGIAVERLRKEFGIDCPYVLYVASGFDYRKNIARTIEAFKSASTTFDSKTMLVITGDLRNLEYPASVESRGIIAKRENGIIKFTGYVRDESMPALYNGADLCIFPSLYEGGGLAMLEAMASGKPILASDLPTLRELAGDAAEFVDPHDPQQIAEGLVRLLSSPQRRRELGHKALEKSHQFSWERTAKETVQVYKQVLGQA